MSDRIGYRAQSLAANASFKVEGDYLKGFLCKAAGTIKVVGWNDLGTAAVTYLDDIPVAAGAFVEFPIKAQAPGFTVTLGSNASGTLFY